MSFFLLHSLAIFQLNVVTMYLFHVPLFILMSFVPCSRVDDSKLSGNDQVQAIEKEVHVGL